MGVLRTSDEALDDAEIAARLGARGRQAIATARRRLESLGLLRRFPGPDGAMVNVLTARHPSEVGAVDSRRIGVADLVSEETVKTAVKSYLEAQGWSVGVASGQARGVGIAAKREAERLMLETKGGAPNPPQQVIAAGAVGELVQRLRDPHTRYGLALPDNLQYRRLVDRLPRLARERVVQVVYLVDPATASDVVVLD